MVILGVNNKIYIFCLYIRKLWVSDHTDTPVCFKFNRIGCPHRGQHTQLFFYSQELLIDIPVLKGSEGCHPKMMKEPKNSSYLLWWHIVKLNVHGTSNVCYDSQSCQSRLRHKLVVAKHTGQTQLWCVNTPAARQTIHPECGCELFGL